MKDWIKADRIVFKIGSLEWLNYFGLPSGFLVLSLIQLYFFLKDSSCIKSDVYLSGFIITFLLGTSSYLLQLRRLEFKTLKLTRDIEEFKIELKSLLLNNHWVIDYDNKLYLQATFCDSIFNQDMLTIKFKTTQIQWCVIRHPHSYNSIAALLTLNREGNKIIKKIKTFA